MTLVELVLGAKRVLSLNLNTTASSSGTVKILLLGSLIAVYSTPVHNSKFVCCKLCLAENVIKLIKVKD
jgi:hypothetical protein